MTDMAASVQIAFDSQAPARIIVNNSHYELNTIMSRPCPRPVRALLLLVGFLGLAGLVRTAAAADELAPTIVHMLGYIGVDYPGTVRNGKVADGTEYAEQREFAGRVHELLGKLPDAPEKPALLKQAGELSRRIERKAAGATLGVSGGEGYASTTRGPSPFLKSGAIRLRESTTSFPPW